VNDVARDDVSVLSPDEVERAGRFRFEADRVRYRVARSLLRRTAANLLGVPPSDIPLETAEYGKPFITGRPFELNVSHSGDLIAVAVSASVVGVDVERIQTRTAIDEIAARYFQDQELGFLRGLPPDAKRRAFFALWTTKEAAMKADGGGLWLSLSSVAIDDPAAAGNAPVHCSVARRPWLVRPLNVPDGYCAAVATERQTSIVIKTKI